MIKKFCVLMLAGFLMFVATGTVRAAQLSVHDNAGCSYYNNSGVTNFAAFSRWLGQTPERVVDFLYLYDWPDMVRSSALLPSCWRTAGVTYLTVSLPMIASDGKSSLVAGAGGAYDRYYLQIAQNLVANGYPNAVVRIGWEMNIANWPWYAAKNPSAYVRLWRRIVDIMRSVPGQAFQFDWNPSLWCNYGTTGTIAPPLVYPGDGYVDIIGLDVYNEVWGNLAKPEAQRWAAMLTQQYALQWQQGFAALHAKPMSYPEWGTGTRPDGHGGGDDPFFIRNMVAWIASNNVLYQSYYDQNTATYNSKISTGAEPLAAAAYIAAYR